jgi:rhodanese-related sulfurtransferase
MLGWLERKGPIMAKILRVSPEEIYSQVKAGASLLVCSYDNEETCRSMRLEGAVSLGEFKTQVSQVPKEQEIIFYCAWNHEHSSAGLADEYQAQGYMNAKALLGGVKAWQQAGLPIMTA